MEKSQKAIQNQIGDLCYHMNGGITWNEAWGLSYSDRNNLVKNLNEKLRKMSGDTREYM